MDTSDEEDDASQELLAQLQKEDAQPISAMRRLSADKKAEVVAEANRLALEGAMALGRRPPAASDPASEFSIA